MIGKDRTTTRVYRSQVANGALRDQTVQNNQIINNNQTIMMGMIARDVKRGLGQAIGASLSQALGKSALSPASAPPPALKL